MHGIVDVSLDTKFLGLVELYSGLSLEMEGCTVVQLGEIAQSLFRSPGTQQSQSEELYFQIFLKWQTVGQERDGTITVVISHIGRVIPRI